MEVLKEVPQPGRTLRSDDDNVTHLTELLEEIMSCLGKCHILEFLEKTHSNWKK